MGGWDDGSRPRPRPTHVTRDKGQVPNKLSTKPAQLLVRDREQGRGLQHYSQSHDWGEVIARKGSNFNERRRTQSTCRSVAADGQQNNSWGTGSNLLEDHRMRKATQNANFLHEFLPPGMVALEGLEDQLAAGSPVRGQVHASVETLAKHASPCRQVATPARSPQQPSHPVKISHCNRVIQSCNQITVANKPFIHNQLDVTTKPSTHNQVTEITESSIRSHVCMAIGPRSWRLAAKRFTIWHLALVSTDSDLRGTGKSSVLWDTF